MTDPTPATAHRLIGSVCTCGDWWAQCGNDIPEQWRQHANAATERPTPATGADQGIRPWCCPEPRCTPLHLLLDGDARLEPGESFVCFGAAPAVEFTYDGVVHVNDTRSCHYSPLKGLIAFQENADDWEALRSAYWRAGASLAAHRQEGQR